MRRRASWLLACWSSALPLNLAACRTATPADPGARHTEPAAWTAPHVERAREQLRAFDLELPAGATRLVVHDTTASFVAATGHDEPALRAWTTWSAVHLMHPRRWGDDSEATRTERITHELCHAAVLHAFADQAAAVAARVPRFFAEGACSVVAGQARLPLGAVVARAAGALPLTVAWFTDDPDVAYGASHALAALVVRDHGTGAFARILEDAARDGRPGCVERALLALTGAPDVVALWRRAVDRSVDSAVPAP